ncbi:hypothetical protein GF356_02040 [candidate division GN15 bacterium]|nr:hypothetical protein [candidate division GN15 bacterium]
MIPLIRTHRILPGMATVFETLVELLVPTATAITQWGRGVAMAVRGVLKGRIRNLATRYASGRTVRVHVGLITGVD